MDLAGLAARQVELTGWAAWAAHAFPTRNLLVDAAKPAEQWRSLLGAAAVAPPGGRSAARIICVNDQREVLLMRWRSPDGALCWEPPGGGIEPGELPVDAARREWAEATGFSGEMVGDQHVFVHRDLCWNGARYVAEEALEAFFLARCVGGPEVSTRGMTANKLAEFAGYRWVPIRELDALPDRVEPADLAGVIRQLI